MVTKRFHNSEPTHDWILSGWARPAEPGHYRWAPGLPATRHGAQCDSDRLWLISDPTPARLIRYSPLTDTPALFRTFADLPHNAVEFLRFADRYGQLGTYENYTLGNQLCSGESLTRHLSEHDAMRQVVGMLAALNGRRSLEAYARSVPPHPLITPALRAASFPVLKGACLAWVQSRINERLSGVDRETGDAVVAHLGFDRFGKLRLQQQTRSLLGILWLQCARAAEGDQTFRQCRSCRNWMLISPDVGKRRQAIYCSNLCKVRAFRKRHANRRQLGKGKRGTE